MKSDSERGEFGAWLRRARLSQGFRNATVAVAEMKRRAGYSITVSEWAEFEAGTRNPSAERIEALEAFLGAPAPSERSEPEPVYDMAALFDRMDRQTEAIEAVAKGLFEMISRIDRDHQDAARDRRELAKLIALAVPQDTPEETQDVSGQRSPRQAQRRERAVVGRAK